LKNLISGVFEDMLAMSTANRPETAEMMRFNQELLTSIAERLNLLSLLRSYPVVFPA
jgi:hypothetical protein